MFLLVLEVAAFAAIINGAGRVAGNLASGLFDGVIAVVASLFGLLIVVEFLAALAVSEQSFLAAHAHLLLVTQLPVLAVCGGMVAGRSWNPRSWMWQPLLSLILAAVIVGVFYWVWGYFQAIMIAHQADDPYTQPALYAQLGMEGRADARWTQNVIIHLLFTPRIYIAGAVGLVVSAFTAFLWNRR